VDIETFGAAVKVLEHGSKIIRKVGVGRRLVRSARDRTYLTLLREFNDHLLPEIAGAIATDVSEEEIGNLPRNLQHYCDVARNIMADLCQVDEQKMHVTIKVPYSEDIGQSTLRVKQDESTYPRVGTVGRSKPMKRPPEYSPENLYRVSENSAIAALLGISDGKRNWGTQYLVFNCNDLYKFKEQYRCAREDWDKYYRTTLVCPIKCIVPEGRHLAYMGFITFDSLEKDVFQPLPDIYSLDYREYHEKVIYVAKYHLASLLGNLAGIMLSTAVEKGKEEKS